jgi:hypothetical protein
MKAPDSRRKGANNKKATITKLEKSAKDMKKTLTGKKFRQIPQIKHPQVAGKHEK